MEKGRQLVAELLAKELTDGIVQGGATLSAILALRQAIALIAPQPLLKRLGKSGDAALLAAVK